MTNSHIITTDKQQIFLIFCRKVLQILHLKSVIVGTSLQCPKSMTYHSKSFQIIPIGNNFQTLSATFFSPTFFQLIEIILFSIDTTDTYHNSNNCKSSRDPAELFWFELLQYQCEEIQAPKKFYFPSDLENEISVSKKRSR